MLAALTTALDSCDQCTSAHTKATIVLVRAVGERLGLGVDGLCELERIAAVHDVGILAGEEIPLTSRIVFACDAYQAMISERPYRPALERAEAVSELQTAAGRQFDPQIVKTLLRVLGEEAPQVTFAPRDTRERAQALALGDIATEMGATDLFVFRKSSPGVYSHLAGVGRGDGWAGNIELDWADEPHLREAVRGGYAMSVSLQGTGRVVGPYYAGSAIIVPHPDETVVVFGDPGTALKEASTKRASELAARAAALVHDVSAAKRLADELEVLEAVRSVTTLGAENVAATLTGLAERAANALSCEFGAAMTLPTDDHPGVIGVASDGWQPASEELLRRAMEGLIEGALLRYSDEEAATEWRRRLSERLKALNASEGRRDLTISVGVAQASTHTTIADALALADRRMYAEKLARRGSRDTRTI